MSKYKHEIAFGVLIAVFLVAFFFLYGLLLPFFVGLILAFSMNPLINRIQKLVKKRNLATTILLFGLVAIVAGIITLFAHHINRDFKRLNHSYTVLMSQNQEKLDETGMKVRGYLESVLEMDEIKNLRESRLDSTAIDLNNLGESKIDTESIKTAFENIAALFPSSGEKEEETEKSNGFGFAFMFFSAIGYFVLILFQMEYFSGIKKKYLKGRVENGLKSFTDDLNNSFVRYFKLRVRIVLILTVIYFTAFMILDMPGMIMLTIAIAILSFIPYLHYVALIPIALGCLVLSVEHEQSFLLYFGIVVGVFILASILEELVLIPRIMERNIGMNPVIMILSVSVWSYLLGIPGLLLGIPLTILLISYFKRLLVVFDSEG